MNNNVKKKLSIKKYLFKNQKNIVKVEKHLVI